MRITPERPAIVSPEGAFLSFLSPGPPVEPESPSPASSSSPASPDTGMGPEPGRTSKRKKSSGDMETGAFALVPQPPDMSKAARWLLSPTVVSGAAPLALPAPPSVLKPAAQPLAATPEGAAPDLQLAQKEVPAAPDLSLKTIANPDGLARVAADRVAPGTRDLAAFAELTLTPTASTATASRMTTLKPDSAQTSSQAVSSPQHASSAEPGPQSKSATGSLDGPALSPGDPDQSRDSSSESFSDRQQLAPTAPKKKDDTGGGHSENFKIPSDLRVSDQMAAPSSIAAPAGESRRVRNSPEPPIMAPSIPETTTSEVANRGGSSVGTIELQVKSADQSSVALRFVERQGQIEIQMKSGDQRTVNALSENLSALKTSLNETGWDVEGRIQVRSAAVVRTAQIVANADRGSSPVAQLQSSTVSARLAFDSSPNAPQPLDSHQSVRLEQVSSAHTNPQSAVDSPEKQSQFPSDRSDSSGRKGQQGRNDSAGADSGGQGRRSAKESEVWLESMESSLTRSSSVQATTGITK